MLEEKRVIYQITPYLCSYRPNENKKGSMPYTVSIGSLFGQIFYLVKSISPFSFHFIINMFFFKISDLKPRISLHRKVIRERLNLI